MTDQIDSLIGTLTTPPAPKAAALKAGVRANVTTATSGEAKSQTGDIITTVERVREQVLAGVSPVLVVTANARTLVPDDLNKILPLSDGTGVAVTLPNDMPVGFGCTLVQWGVGKITLAAASGASLRQEDGYTKTKQRYSAIALSVITNSGGTAAEWLAVGSMSA